MQALLFQLHSIIFPCNISYYYGGKNESSCVKFQIFVYQLLFFLQTWQQRRFRHQQFGAIYLWVGAIYQSMQNEIRSKRSQLCNKIFTAAFHILNPSSLESISTLQFRAKRFIHSSIISDIHYNQIIASFLTRFSIVLYVRIAQDRNLNYKTLYLIMKFRYVCQLLVDGYYIIF